MAKKKEPSLDSFDTPSPRSIVDLDAAAAIPAAASGDDLTTRWFKGSSPVDAAATAGATVEAPIHDRQPVAPPAATAVCAASVAAPPKAAARQQRWSRSTQPTAANVAVEEVVHHDVGTGQPVAPQEAPSAELNCFAMLMDNFANSGPEAAAASGANASNAAAHVPMAAGSSNDATDVTAPVPAARLSNAEIAEVQVWLVRMAWPHFKFRMMVAAHFKRSKQAGGPVMAANVQDCITTSSWRADAWESTIEVPNSFEMDDAIVQRAFGFGATEAEATEEASKALFTALFIDDGVRNTTSSKLTLHAKHWKIPLADLLRGAQVGAPRLEPFLQIPFATPTSRLDSRREMYRPIRAPETMADREQDIVNFSYGLVREKPRVRGLVHKRWQDIGAAYSASKAGDAVDVALVGQQTFG